jgi:tetratricopeptide (TPR) repeat protein
MLKPYQHLVAENNLHQMKEKAARELGQVIRGRGWTQAQAAGYLSVSQPRISNLLAGQTQKFTLDMLITMLISLDRPVELSFPDPAQWTRSAPWKIDPNHQEALKIVQHYTQLISEDPNNALAYKRRADPYHQLGQNLQALADYTRAYELDPSRPGAIFNRAGVYRELKQFKAALKDYKTILQRFPECHIHQSRSLVYLDMQDYESAMHDMDKACQLQPERPGPGANRANLHRSLGNLAQARADYQKVLEVDPTSTYAKQALAELQ